MSARFKFGLGVQLLGVLFCFHCTDALSQASVQRAVQVPSSELNTLGGLSPHSESEGQAESLLDHLNLQYFGILFGPSVQSPSSFQPDPERTLKDLSRPLLLRNLVGLSYDLSDEVSVTPTVGWLWQPVLKHETTAEDPFLKVAHRSLMTYKNLNLYADARVHFPVSPYSRENQQLLGLQTVQVLTYEIENSRWMLGLYGAGRYNVIRSEGGRGNDVELYLAPNVSYQWMPRLALTLLYEVRYNHIFGQKAFFLQNDEMDLEPGVSWDVTPGLMINPYLHIPTKGLGLAATSVGMMINWTLF